MKLFNIYIKQWNKAISQGTDNISVEEPNKKLKILLYEWQKQQSEISKVKKEKIEANKKEDNEAEKKERIKAPAKETPL